MPAIESRIYQVDSFVGVGCGGNRHRVYLNPPFRSSAERDGWLAGQDGIVVLLALDSRSPLPRLAFYEFARRIHRCGSGTLAAVQVLHHLKHELTAVATPAGEIPLRREGNRFGYAAEHPVITAAERDFWSPLLDKPIHNCCLVGGDEDYCLVELESEAAVHDLAVNIEQLSRSTARALIVTAAASRSGYDYVLRYFAPRHGKAEDPATGSANPPLADYWQQRLGKSLLRARQLSREGGDFLLQVEPDKIWVMGKALWARG